MLLSFSRVYVDSCVDYWLLEGKDAVQFFFLYILDSLVEHMTMHRDPV